MSPVIGLTGGIGSGKTLVSNAFAAHGVGIVDADVIAHALTAPAGEAVSTIEAQFGSAFITPEKALDRAAMRALVFAQPQAKAQLEAILHPLIRANTLAQLRAAATPYTLLVVPLMVESGKWLKTCSRLLVVDCAESTQLSRVQTRSGLDAATVQNIMQAQASRQQRLAAADDVIFNENKALAVVTAEVASLHQHYLTKLLGARWAHTL